MIEKAIEYLFDPRILIGAIIAAPIVFKICQHNPEWVQKFYQQQVDNVKGLPAATQEKIAQAEKIIADQELEKKVTEILNKLQGK